MQRNLLIALLSVACLLCPQLSAQQNDYLHKMFLEEKAKAEKGDAESQVRLGNVYAYGSSHAGVDKNYAEALKWYRKAADQNYAKAQIKMGDCFSYGRLVEKNPKEAEVWYRKAADQNSPEAQFEIGNRYKMGSDWVVYRDSLEALKWYRKAAEQGHADAQLELAFFLPVRSRNDAKGGLSGGVCVV